MEGEGEKGEVQLSLLELPYPQSHPSKQARICLFGLFVNNSLLPFYSK